MVLVSVPPMKVICLVVAGLPYLRVIVFVSEVKFTIEFTVKITTVEVSEYVVLVSENVRMALNLYLFMAFVVLVVVKVSLVIPDPAETLFQVVPVVVSEEYCH
jgi:hypothetical protein